MTTDNPIMNQMELTLKRNMLKWHVGHVMFCPVCQKVMDCRKAVEIDVYQRAIDADGSEKQGELVTSKITCAKCYDGAAVRIADAVRAKGFIGEVIDGRVIFARAKRGKK